MLAPMFASRWKQLCENAGLDSCAGWTAIAAAYGDPARTYHNLRHIADCLFLLDEYAELAADTVAIEFAIWFHDIVYDSRAADNEERSADLAMEFLCNTPHASTVADLIMATKHGKDGLSADSALICDIDLSILGRPPTEYKAYAAEIRLEYAWVPPPQYAEGRSRVLGGFLKRPALFHHPEFQQRFETPAKANLAWELRELVKDSPSQPLASNR